MRKSSLMIASAGALGLAASLALAQQDKPSLTEHKTQIEPAATEASESQAEMRSIEETIADHRKAFFARVEETRRANEGSQGEVEVRRGLRYHPAW